VGEQGWALTKIGGWAEAFTDIGFSGFIGPYWAVNDRIARKSSLLFYRSLSAGLSVGEAVRQIRRQFYDDADDAGHPSWLAYTLHCQPNIHIQMPPSAAPATGTSAEEKTNG
jgi:CHAT domain-containing protein